MTDEPQQSPPPGQVPGAQPPPGAYPPAGHYAPPGQYPPGAYGYQPVYVPAKHPQATLAMVLGIVGLTSVMCYITAVVAPFAWWVGAKAVREIDAEPTRYSGRGEAMAGKIMGIIGTVLLVLGLLLIAGFVALLITSVEFRSEFSEGWDETSILGAF